MSANTDAAIFKPETIADKVRERIQTSFADLIPEESWKAMVQKAIQDFTERRPGDYRNNHQPQPSILQELIDKEIQRRFIEALKVELDKPEWRGLYTPTGEQASAMVKELTLKMIPEMQAQFFAQMVQMFTGDLRNNINQIASRLAM